MSNRLPLFAASALLAATLMAQEDQGKVVSVGEAADHAVQQSKLTLPGGTPFHLKAHIASSGRPNRSIPLTWKNTGSLRRNGGGQWRPPAFPKL